jgi:muconolactone D-isomerase
MTSRSIPSGVDVLFHVRMDVQLPADLDPQIRCELVGREKAYSQDLQRKGKWPHIWRVVGEYANYSIFDVESNDELHQLLSALPLFPYMHIRVTPLATHPSDVTAT